MTPIYLYVEQYKALSNQELRLSTKYDVIKNKNEFTVNRISDSSPFINYYGHNLDISAIFGKNGTGKSSAIDVLIAAIIKQDDFLGMNYTFIYEQKGTLYFYSNSVIDIEIPIVKYENELLTLTSPIDVITKDEGVIYFSHQVEPLANKVKFKQSKLFRFVDISNQAFVNKLNRSTFKNKEIAECFNFLESGGGQQFGIKEVPMVATFGLSKEIAKRIKEIYKHINLIAKNLPESLKNEYHNEVLHNLKLSNEGPLKDMIISDIYHNIHKGENFNEQTKETTTFINRLDRLFGQYTEHFTQRFIKIYEEELDLIEVIIEFDGFLNSIKEFKRNYTKKTLIEPSNEFFEDLLNYTIYFLTYCNTPNDHYSLSSTVSNHLFNALPHVTHLNKNTASELAQLSKFIRHSKHIQLSGETFYGVKSYEEFVWLNKIIQRYSKLFSHFEFKWNGISSGQYSILTMFSRLYEASKSFEEAIIIVDEGEVNLHPEWQRNYINDLVNFFKYTCSNVKVTLILTSHSPFVLGDLYSKSTNILGQQKTNEKCLFASNIYDLYSDGFLLERTIGEFAFNKIKQLSQDIDSESVKVGVAKELISAIGDLFVQKILTDKLEGES